MKKLPAVPTSITEAISRFTSHDIANLETLTKEDFLSVWSALSYLYPGLHPDGYECEDCGWPEELKPHAAEAWRRNELGELDDNELYPSDSQWAGLYDQMTSHTAEEKEFRARIAAGG
jgi:hypothetical protein